MKWEAGKNKWPLNAGRRSGRGATGFDTARSEWPTEQFRQSFPQGWTLIELLVVLTVAAVMMGLGVTTIHLLLGSEHEAMKSVRYSASVTRLARVFRED